MSSPTLRAAIFVLTATVYVLQTERANSQGIEAAIEKNLRVNGTADAPFKGGDFLSVDAIAAVRAPDNQFADAGFMLYAEILDNTGGIMDFAADAKSFPNGQFGVLSLTTIENVPIYLVPSNENVPFYPVNVWVAYAFTAPNNELIFEQLTSSHGTFARGGAVPGLIE